MIDMLAEAILSHAWGWDNVRRDVFQLLAWAYTDAETRIRQEHIETEITWLLSEAMDNKLMYSDLPPRFIFYNVKEEAHVKNLPGVSQGRKRIDIEIEHTGNRPYKKYVLEAKRCDRNYQKGIEWYSEGIKSFIKRDYAREAPEASVIGLMQTDTEKYWTDELQMNALKEPTLMCETHLTGIKVVAELPGLIVSKHRRKDNSIIELYHVFLDCKKL